MNPSLRLAPRKLLGLAQSLRCLQQIRTATHLRREELARALDDQIRAKFPRSSAVEVEAVVEARREIWGGTSGGVYVTPIGAGMITKLTGWSKTKVDKRSRNEDEQEMKRQRLENGDDEQLPIYAKKFSEEAIKAEGRRPKKKVAVLIGYAGTGYRGMQLSVSLAWSSRLTIVSRL
jgi:hypothetical protein